MIVFLHNDLDAAGCEIVISSVFNVKEYFYTDYTDFEIKANQIIEYANKNNESELLIADLSFAERPQTLELLSKNFKSILHIDHHSYPENFFKNLKMKNIYKKIINEQYCASKLCYDFFINNKNDYLDNLINVIDAYDCWKTDSPLFDRGQNLNKYFWEVSYANFLNFKNGIPENYQTTVEDIIKKEQEKIEKIKNNNLIFKAKLMPVTFIFTFECFNPIMLEEFKKQVIFFIGIVDNKVRVRINKNCINMYEIEKMRYALAEKVTGHPCAFSYKFSGNIIDEVKRITDIINENYVDIPF